MAPKKLLVVDDEVCLTEVVAHALTKAGYEVLTAEDGEEGYALACRELPDLVVTDYQMPQLDGLQFSARLKETATTSEIPVILLTARGHRVGAADLARTNIREVMAKPFSSRHLRARIDEILGGAMMPLPARVL